VLLVLLYHKKGEKDLELNFKNSKRVSYISLYKKY